MGPGFESLASHQTENPVDIRQDFLFVLFIALIGLTQQLAKSLQFEDLYTPTVGEALSLPPGNDACVFG